MEGAPRWGRKSRSQGTAGERDNQTNGSSFLTGLFLQAVAFLAMVMGTHTFHLWSQKGCPHWPNCCPSKGQNPIEEWLKQNAVLMPPLEMASPTPHPESCKASEDGPLNSRSIAPWRYE